MNKYGVIGRTLKHSFSKIIHENYFDIPFDLIELEPNQLDHYFAKRDFKGITVTIPYKQDVFKYLDYIDDAAREIHAVNVIVNNDGKLFGYNTDYLGLRDLIETNNIEIEGKNVLILGNGGTSKTSQYLMKLLKAKKVTVVSRAPIDNEISFDDALDKTDTQVIINTTPVGMYPNNDGEIIKLNSFVNLEAVVDVVYNPLRTNVLVKAKEMGVKYAGGLYMLIAQAFYARELFFNQTFDKSIIKKIFVEMKKEKENIVLIGMPSCGKSTSAVHLSNKLHKQVIDTDYEILINTGLKPDVYIVSKGIDEFRKVESKIVYEASKKQNVIISTGGGVVLNEKNMTYLKQNGVIVYINRPLSLLEATEDRPLSRTKKDLEKLYQSRHKLYEKYADIIIDNDSDIDVMINKIIKEFNEYEENTRA